MKKIYRFKIKKYTSTGFDPIYDVYVNGVWECPGYNTLKEAKARVEELIKNL